MNIKIFKYKISIKQYQNKIETVENICTAYNPVSPPVSAYIKLYRNYIKFSIKKMDNECKQIFPIVGN